MPAAAFVHVHRALDGAGVESRVAQLDLVVRGLRASIVLT